MSDSASLEAAAFEAKAARKRLHATAAEVRARLDPATLVDEAVSGAKSGAAELAETVGDAVWRRPGAAIGVAAATTIFLLRRPLARLFRRTPNDRSATGRRRRR